MRATALLRVVTDWRARPFEYGAVDCCQFARAVVREITGDDLGAEWQYATEQEAREIIDRHGSLSALVTHYLGESVSAEKLRIGDICLVAAPGFEMLGAKSRIGAYVPTENGIGMAGNHRITHGWAI